MKDERRFSRGIAELSCRKSLSLFEGDTEVISMREAYDGSELVLCKLAHTDRRVRRMVELELGPRADVCFGIRLDSVSSVVCLREGLGQAPVEAQPISKGDGVNLLLDLVQVIHQGATPVLVYEASEKESSYKELIRFYFSTKSVYGGSDLWGLRCFTEPEAFSWIATPESILAMDRCDSIGDWTQRFIDRHTEEGSCETLAVLQCWASYLFLVGSLVEALQTRAPRDVKRDLLKGLPLNQIFRNTQLLSFYVRANTAIREVEKVESPIPEKKVPSLPILSAPESSGEVRLPKILEPNKPLAASWLNGVAHSAGSALSAFGGTNYGLIAIGGEGPVWCLKFPNGLVGQWGCKMRELGGGEAAGFLLSDDGKSISVANLAGNPVDQLVPFRVLHGAVELECATWGAVIDLRPELKEKLERQLELLRLLLARYSGVSVLSGLVITWCRLEESRLRREAPPQCLHAYLIDAISQLRFWHGRFSGVESELRWREDQTPRTLMIVLSVLEQTIFCESQWISVDGVLADFARERGYQVWFLTPDRELTMEASVGTDLKTWKMKILHSDETAETAR